MKEREHLYLEIPTYHDTVIILTSVLFISTQIDILTYVQPVSIRTYSERSQRSTQEPKRDPSGPEGTARTPQATDSRAYAAKRYTVIEYCATRYAT